MLALVLDRLAADEELAAGVDLIVLAACEGPESLDQALDGSPKPRPEVVRSSSDAEPAGAYLTSVTVEGFRGIGPATKLDVTPGPGLTLVVGRNGSGKSSFVEGLEYLLTGQSLRWDGRKSRLWAEGWRNLHHPHARIAATFALDGVADGFGVEVEWADDSELREGTVRATNGGSANPIGEAGWADALETHRPFLSYNELGSMFEEGPSKLYDALFSILGLGELAEAQKLLSDRRKAIKDLIDGAKKDRTLLVSDLGAVDDERAAEVVDALGTTGTKWDADRVEAIVLDASGASEDGVLASLQRLTVLAAPDAETVDALVGEIEAVLALRSSITVDSERALHTAELLRQALDHHRHFGDAPCPVCGGRDLDSEWRVGTEHAEAQFRAEAHAAEEAQRKERSVRDRLQAVARIPQFTDDCERVGIEASALLSAWERLAALPDDLAEVAAHHREAGAEVERATEEVRAAAAVKLEKEQANWRPVATRLLEWLDRARAAQRLEPTLKQVGAAVTWLNGAADEIRNDRLAPLRQRAASTWDLLRCQSNVELGPIVMEGTKTSRRVTLDVKVDGNPSVALSVMSQGELHALALAIFLPRAMMPESPFRFIVIDDPVQAMDPAKVDGLARALEDAAHTRQVIVCTHDDRLPEAVRRLGIEATVLNVSRRTESVVEIVRGSDPAERHLNDAFAVAKTEDLPRVVGERVVPGFCRLAVEAVLTEIARRRLLATGTPHDEVERRIAGATSLNKRLALALFEDSERVQDAHKRLGMYGAEAGDTFRTLNRGAHEGYGGDLVELTRASERLVANLRRLM